MDGNASARYNISDALLCLALSDGRYDFDHKSLGLPSFNRLLRQLFANPTINQWAYFAPGTFLPSVHASQHADSLFQLQGLTEEESNFVIGYCRSLALMEEHRHSAVIPLKSCAAYNKRMLGSQQHRCFLKWIKSIWNGPGRNYKGHGPLSLWLRGVLKTDNSKVFGAVSV
jgi:hypothetical protein